MKEINDIANKIANLHYAEKPVSLKEAAKRQQLINTLKQQIKQVFNERQTDEDDSLIINFAAWITGHDKETIKQMLADYNKH